MATHPFADYLDAQPEPQRSTVIAMAESLRRLLPGAEEKMSYGMPAFAVDGTAVAGLAGFASHCSYFPHSGQVLRELQDDLAGYDQNAGTLRVAIDAPLPVAILRKLVIVRLRLESEHGPRAGKVRAFYDNGHLKHKGGVRDGLMHGAWAWYRRDGSMMRTGSFKNDVRVGVWRTYDRSGRLVKETVLGGASPVGGRRGSS